jgi:hypothetical protein
MVYSMVRLFMFTGVFAMVLVAMVLGWNVFGLDSSSLRLICVTPADPKDPKDARIKVLLAVIVVGESEHRNALVKANLQAMPWQDSNYSITCFLFVYSAYKTTPAWVREHPHCEAIFMYNFRFTSFVKALLPATVRKFDLLTLLLDDVSVSGQFYVPFAKLWEWTLLFNASISTPTVVNSHWCVILTASSVVCI